MKIKHIIWILIYFVLITIMLFIFSYYIISYSVSDKVYTSIDEIPHKKVALVLGTSKYLRNGKENLYFTYRIDAAYKLFEAGKADFFLVSGDNSILNYNEPAMMKKALSEKGVPDSLIFPDYAGFRTLDAIIRCKKVFMEDDIIIISQEFHNERALFIADKTGLNAIAYNAKDIEFSSSYSIILREFGARLKAIMDIYLLNTEPKFLGEPIKIE
jgi:SanA protein